MREGVRGLQRAPPLSHAGCWVKLGHVGLILLRRLREVKTVVQSPTARNGTDGIGSRSVSEVPLFLTVSAGPGLSGSQELPSVLSQALRMASDQLPPACL